jgi:5-methylcytosine-specific restriction endonuclease McrA
MGQRKYGRCGKTEVGWYAIRDPKTRRAWRAQLLQSQKGCCALCGHAFPGPEVNESIQIQFAPTFDHIIGYAAGGSSDLTNLRLVHYDCNRSRESGYPVTVPKVLRASS